MISVNDRIYECCNTTHNQLIKLCWIIYNLQLYCQVFYLA